MLRLDSKSSRRTSKLDLDYRAECALGQAMHTSENRERLNQLSTEVGMLMEDASVIALTIGAVAETDLATVLEQLGRRVSKMHQLLQEAGTRVSKD